MEYEPNHIRYVLHRWRAVKDYKYKMRESVGNSRYLSIKIIITYVPNFPQGRHRVIHWILFPL